MRKAQKGIRCLQKKKKEGKKKSKGGGLRN